jgi:hypothetical protein
MARVADIANEAKRGAIPLPLEGGCHCGALRYRVTAAPVRAGYCHCRICQHTSAAPVQAWAEVPLAGFAYIKGQPRVYLSSAWGQREFCGECGSQILYRDQQGASSVSINTPTLDDPALLPPTTHGFAKDRIAWFNTADDLPRYLGNAPTSPD